MATFHANLVQSFTNFKNKYITPIQTALNNKQDKLTNPLTQSDVVDNLNSTSTTTPLSAYQGKLLNDTKASIDLGGSSSNTHLIWSAPSADEKYATPVHWDSTVGYTFIYIDGVKHYLLRRDDIVNNLTTNSSLKPLSAAQGYTISRDVPWYGTSSTAASTIAKVATTSDSKFALTTGAKVSIKFTYVNTASAPTLNVDSTGAKSIKAYGTTAPTVWWQAGDVVTFTYDGTNWIMGATEGQISQIKTGLDAQKMDWNTEGTPLLTKLSFYNWAGFLSNFINNGDGRYYQDIVFRYTFKYLPIVTCWETGATANVTGMSIENLTTSGCRLWVRAVDTNMIIHAQFLGVLP